MFKKLEQVIFDTCDNKSILSLWLQKEQLGKLR